MAAEVETRVVDARTGIHAPPQVLSRSDTAAGVSSRLSRECRCNGVSRRHEMVGQARHRVPMVNMVVALPQIGLGGIRTEPPHSDRPASEELLGIGLGYRLLREMRMRGLQGHLTRAKGVEKLDSGLNLRWPNRGGGRPLRRRLSGLVFVIGFGVLAEWSAAAGETPHLGETETCIGAPSAHCVFEWSAAQAATIADNFDRAYAFTRIAEAKVRAGYGATARYDLSRALTSALEIGSEGDVARPLTKRIDDELPYLRTEALTRIASAQLTMNEPDRARRTVARALSTAATIGSDYWRAHQLILIAQVQGAAGALAEARKSIAAATVDRAGSSFGLSLRECAAAQAAAGDFEGALVTAQAIRSESLRNGSFADIVRAQARSGDDSGALVTVQRIEKTYFRMLAMYHIGTARAEAGDTNGAMRAAESILDIWLGALGEFLWRDAEILYSDTLMAVAEAHVAAGQYEEALSLAAEIPDPLPDVITRGAVAMALLSAGNLDAARTAAEGMCWGRHLRYGDDCVKVLAALAPEYAAANAPDAASETVAAASRIAGQIIYYPDRSRAFAAIWQAQTRMGDAEGARHAFATALAAAADTDDLEDRADELIFLASTAAELGRFSEADRVFAAATSAAERIEAPRVRANALARTGAARAQTNNREGARQLFSEALRTAAFLEHDPLQRVTILADIASALAAIEP